MESSVAVKNDGARLIDPPTTRHKGNSSREGGIVTTVRILFFRDSGECPFTFLNDMLA
jgi:hypothetical protein